MSAQENAAVVERYAAAWAAGDFPGLVACYHPDFTLHYGGDNPLAGVHAGKPAALAALAEVTRKTGRKLLEVIDVLPGARRSAVVVRESFQAGDRSAELERVLVYTVKDGLLHHCWVYDEDQALVDSFLR